MSDGKREFKRSDITTAMVLWACREARSRASSDSAFQLLISITGAPEKVISRAMERDHDRGYLDYGVTLRCAWLTEAGEAKLQVSPLSLCTSEEMVRVLNKWTIALYAGAQGTP